MGSHIIVVESTGQPGEGAGGGGYPPLQVENGTQKGQDAAKCLSETELRLTTS